MLSVFSLYYPGCSIIHRLQAGYKLAALCLFSALIIKTSHLFLLLVALFYALILYLLAKVKISLAFAQLYAMRWLFGWLFLAQLFSDSWISACQMLLRSSSLILLASLVTLTSRPSEMLSAFKSALSPLVLLGFNPEKISLGLSLVFRLIPLIAQVVHQVQEAQRARHLDRHFTAIIVPIFAHMIQFADNMSDAIRARTFERSSSDL
jgi:biotin transport system permease protein